MSRDPRIDAYIAKAQPFARPILEQVRERVHAAVPDIEEGMKWCVPTYLMTGVPENAALGPGTAFTAAETRAFRRTYALLPR